MTDAKRTSAATSGGATDAPWLACTNEDHDSPTLAVYDVSFPDGDWNGCLACKDCLQLVVEAMLDHPTNVLFQAVRQPSKKGDARG